MMTSVKSIDCHCGERHAVLLVIGANNNGETVYLNQGRCGPIYAYFSGEPIEEHLNEMLIAKHAERIPIPMVDMPISCSWRNAPDASCIGCKTIDAQDLKMPKQTRMCRGV